MAALLKEISAALNAVHMEVIAFVLNHRKRVPLRIRIFINGEIDESRGAERKASRSCRTRSCGEHQRNCP